MSVWEHWQQFIFLCFFVAPGLAQSQNSYLPVQPYQPFTSLDGYLEILEDPKGEYEYETLSLKMWEKHEGRVELGQTSSVWWIRFTLQNSGTKPIGLHLDIGFPQLDNIQVFQPDANQPIQLGDDFPYHSRPIKARTFVAPIHVMPGQHQYYVRVKSTSSFSAPLSVVSPETHFERILKEQTALGMFYGLAITLILYNLVLYLTSREPANGIFVVCCIGMTGMAASFDGTGFSFWGNQLYWQDRAIFFFVSMTLFSLYQFARFYLDLAGTGSKIEKLLIVIFYIWLLLAIISLVLTIPWLIKIIVPMALPGFLLMGVIAAICLKQGNIIAGYFLFAVIMLVFIGAFTSLAAVGIIGGFYLLSFVGMKLAFTTMMVLLSFGQAHRIRRFRLLRRQMAEKLIHARAESEAKTSLLTKMSHELRTPMNAVLGIVELIKDTPLNKQQKDYLMVVDNAGRSLLSVIDDVLDYARLETDKVTLHLEPFDLHQLLSECHQIIQGGYLKKALDIRFEWQAQTPQYIVCDPSRLRQVILNLLGNACKFTEKGHVVLRAWAGKKEQVFQEVNIEVEDTGIGITPEAAEKLFQPFSQANTSTTRDYGGTGLGLSISKQLVELMGGQIRLDSEIGKGSRFHFTIKVRLASSPTHVKEKKTKEYPQCSHLNVLVAEDNPVNRKVASGFLRRLGIQPEFAENGREAVDAYSATPKKWDLIFMDCDMPEMDGYEATVAIRMLENEKELHTVPIIGLSAHALPEYRERGLSNGMQEYLHKPLIFDKLVETINRFTDQEKV